MFSSKKLVLGILTVVALSVATAVSSGVQAQVNHNQESIVAIGNKGEELKQVLQRSRVGSSISR